MTGCDNTHGAGSCSVAYVTYEGHPALLSCGADGKILLRSADDPSKILRSFANLKHGPLYCLAVSPKPGSARFVTGTAGEVRVRCCSGLAGAHIVKRAGDLPAPSCLADVISAASAQYYKESEEWNSSPLLRTEQLPVRCISYSPSGSMLAVVGDNFNVTHINLSAGSKVKFRNEACRYGVQGGDFIMKAAANEARSATARTRQHTVWISSEVWSAHCSQLSSTRGWTTRSRAWRMTPTRTRDCWPC